MNKNPEAKERPEIDTLYRLTWRNWIFLSGVLILASLGLSTALPPLLSERIVNPWPWIKTDFILIIGLSVMILTFVAYLTQQQRHVFTVNHRMQLLMSESEERKKKLIVRLYALIKLGRKMADETDLQAVFNCITDTCVEAFDSFRSSLMLYEKETNELSLRAVSGRKGADIIDSRLALGEGIAGWAARKREALLIGGADDSKKYPELELHDSSVTSAMVVPIILREELVGVINVSSTSPEILYDREDLHALQVLAEHTGAYLRHAEQAHWMRQTIRNMRKSRHGDDDHTAIGRKKDIVIVER